MTETDGVEERPLWRVLFDEVAQQLDGGEVTIGDVLTHEQLRDLCGDRQPLVYYQAMHRVGRELRQARKRDLVVVRGVGYKVIAGYDQVVVGMRGQRKAQARIQLAREVIENSDRALMSDEQRQHTVMATRALSALGAVLQMTVQKLAQHEEHLQRLTEAQIEDRSRLQATEEDVAAMRAELSALRARVGGAKE